MMLRYPSAHAVRSATRPCRLHDHFKAAAAAAVAAAATSGTRHDSFATAVFVAPVEQHLQHLASMLAQQRWPGDCYCLHGPVGSGKSVFSRAFIRSAAADPQLPVPSPTYLLQMIYDDQAGPPIHHFDLYRLDRQSDMSRLDLAQSFDTAVSLVEWAERLSEQQLPQHRLEVHIGIMQEPTGLPSEGPDLENHVQQPQQPQQQQVLLPSISQLQLQQQQHPAGCVATIVLPTPRLSQLHQGASGRGAATDQDSSTTADLAPAGPAAKELTSLPDGSCELDEEAEDPFTDKRWRKVTLRAFGTDWIGRLQHLAEHMVSTMEPMVL